MQIEYFAEKIAPTYKVIFELAREGWEYDTNGEVHIFKRPIKAAEEAEK